VEPFPKVTTMSQNLKGLLVSDFNAENLAAYLRNDSNEPAVDCEVAPFGQVAQSLLEASLPFWQLPLDFVVVWSRPEAVLESFARALDGFAVDADVIRKEVDTYCQQLLLAKDRARVIFVPTWGLPAAHPGQGMLDLAPQVGVARLLMQANLRLLEN